MLEGVQYNTRCNWIIVGVRFSHYAHGHYQPFSLMAGHLPKNKQKILPLAILFLTCFGLYSESVALVQSRKILRAIPPSLSPSSVARKKTSKKEWPHKILGLRSPWKEGFSPSGFQEAIFSSWLLTVTHDRLSERGATCSLAQKSLQQFSPNNALLLAGAIIN